MDWPTFWGAVFFLLIGGGFAIFGGYQVVTTYAFMGTAEERPATVLENPDRCDDDGCTWWPTLQVQEADGTERVTRTRFGASNYGWGEGAEITVLSNRAYDYVRIPGADNLYLLGGAFFCIGMLPVVIAFWLLAKLVFTRAKVD
ncbi:hypothetical protein [Pseudooceanicola sp.]|uniref:hypothetical protein n=1 Tax=Pseudooceanicola sp. TaxID=1914328 RepID=UPI0035C76049